jgi:hypothetical protein
MGVFILSNVRIDLDHGTTMFVGGLLVLNLVRIDLDHGTTMFVGGLLVLNLVRIDLDHGTTMFVGGMLVVVLQLVRGEREVGVCTHVRVYTFSMCVHILNLVHVLNLDLVRILLLFPCKKIDILSISSFLCKVLVKNNVHSDMNILNIKM